ncbi:PEP-CTERM sorting domain-containing protein [Aliishimia ponticola]|uniref:PEP-CTERM sorting domain-containing protein n=1 Tax=Aliishimia ponticola TaxID=2499833 RepID=A0A4S4NLQ0_9RHOB|nr:PEP-CTERM sorting domain-containing protein [Aliishimia ponticola]THH37100.1 PEP-CTERM sorting domain-containing protein [Aliishimia ponticola]
MTVNYQKSGNPFGNEGLYLPVTIDSEVYDGTFNAGGFAMTSEPLGEFFAFCIEVTQALRNGATYESVSNPFTDAVLANIEGLFNSAYDNVTDKVTSAAFQVAMWEIVEDTATGFDLSAGAFSAIDASTFSGSVIDTAQGFLDGLATAPTGLFEVNYLLSPTSQDLVTAQRVTPPAAVPVPASGLLLLSAGVFLASRRRNTKPVS